ncbi:MAG TPA: 50S ribosomal protein L15 [Deltaproteobacteria bacterium]|nr:50S ribosomal protein L15 [Deltaproteobacteria bacterium]HRW80850.1 50S ribosomal protein L15 [Desulfomonilia bacterium]NMD40787.1 50S ribosomal protein L15 [Deltaproteobacteria bacterium]HNQ86403.1 50S ribosomal protein L15 [Deltaproteobacteria bacterium]HNS90618.1 50S ribosomal protein L15 [Deltaproteobacteria bacterium]
MDLSNLKAAAGSRKKKQRVGRGNASGMGTTSGRGAKGQKARSGGSVPLWFEGGQMPIYRRLPKRGFKNRFRVEYAVVNIRDLTVFEKGAVVDRKALREKGKIPSLQVSVKLLADGEIDFPLTVKLEKASQAAVDKIVKAGGTFEQL